MFPLLPFGPRYPVCPSAEIFPQSKSPQLNCPTNLNSDPAERAIVCSNLPFPRLVIGIAVPIFHPLTVPTIYRFAGFQTAIGEADTLIDFWVASASITILYIPVVPVNCMFSSGEATKLEDQVLKYL